MRIPFQLSILASSVILAGCGGGGGGPGGSNVDSGAGFIRSSVSYATPSRINHYTPLSGSGVNAVVSDVFVKDLNNDSVDEVVVGGRQTQPATAATWRNTNMQLYGWNTGSFSNETSTWFSGSDNVIVGSEPSIKFGDFDGDGNIDMFSAPSTDMSDLYGNAVVFRNSGSDSFTRSNIATAAGDSWTHDSWVGDLNGDGRDDIVMSNIGGDHNLVVNYGNADGTFSTYYGTTPGGSGISVADYLGDGSMTIILTDTATAVQSDTKLFSFTTSGTNTLSLTEVATLPTSYFYNGNFTSELATAGNDPHEIRNFTMDFNNDGVQDVVVVSNLSGNDVNMSAMQFLRNDGAGSFTDVTDTVLVNYDHDIQASYQPVIIDVNNDGLDDILLSTSDDMATGYHDGTRVLIQTSDGKFVQKYDEVFTDFYNQIYSGTSNAINWAQPINIVVGPDGEKYLFSTVMYNDSGNVKAHTYLSKVGTTGTISAQSAADVIAANWPYLSDPSVNTVLANTSPLSINGVEVVDLTTALNPINGLGIVATDSTSRVQISGSINVPGFNSTMLNGLQAVDGIGRNYTVDMGVMGYNVNPEFNINPVSQSTQPWASTYLTNNYTAQGVWAIGDNDQYSVATNSTILNTEWNYSFSHTQMSASPWMAFDGVFGSIANTSTLEANISKNYTNGVWHQVGMLNTKTQLNPGLVTDVSDIQAVYGVMGYRNTEWSVQTGVQPVIIGGNLNLTLPTSVDSAGNLQYTDYKVNVRNRPEYFVNATRSFNTKYIDVHVNGSTTSSGNNAASITVETDF
jgi:hypothetical protein